MLGAKKVIALQVTNKVGFSLGFSFAFALQKPNLLVRQVQCDKLSLKCICSWENALLTLFGKVESKHEILSSEGSFKNALIKETT